MIPYLQNCPHDGDGWCLKCVKELALEKEKIAENCTVLALMLADAQKKLKNIRELENDSCW